MWKSLPWCLLVIVLAAGCAARVAPPQNGGAQDRVRRLLQISDAGSLTKPVVDSVIRPARAYMVKVPESFWTDFERRVDRNEAVERLIPVYQARFTPQEVEQLIAFYESPIGRRMVGVQADLNKDVAKALEEWRQQLNLRLGTELNAWASKNQPGAARR